jgi:hypothetical protein
MSQEVYPKKQKHYEPESERNKKKEKPINSQMKKQEDRGRRSSATTGVLAPRNAIL